MEVEERRIEENRKELEYDQDRLKRQINELKRAIVNEEGLRRFCEIAARNLDSLKDDQWRILLETMRVNILVDDADITVKIAASFQNIA